MDTLDVHARAAGASGSVWDIRVPAQAPGRSGAGTTHYREFGPAVGGYAYLEGDLVRPAENGELAGTFTTDARSPLAAVWGPAHAARVQYGDAYAIRDATIGFLPRAGAPMPAETC